MQVIQMNKSYKNNRNKRMSRVEHKRFGKVTISWVVVSFFDFFIFFVLFVGVGIFPNPIFASSSTPSVSSNDISTRLAKDAQTITKQDNTAATSNTSKNVPSPSSSSMQVPQAPQVQPPPILALVPTDNSQNPEAQNNPYPQPFAQSSVVNPSNSVNQGGTINQSTAVASPPAMNAAPISNMSQANETNEINKTNEINEPKGQSLHHPIIVNFADNDQFVLFFSTMDLNRLYLPNDHIVSLNGPPEAFSAHNDDAGIYVAVQTSDPFTLFLSTAEGHHFSILVKPSEKVGGFTYEFHAKSAGALVAKWEEDSPYSELIMKLMRGMINGEAPAGYGFYDISHHAPKIHFYNIGLLKPITLLKGAHLSTIAYEFDNTTDAPVTLSPNEFYHAGTRAVSLSQETVAAKGSAMVYVVISNEPTADSPPS